jgi:hypothetical protein
VDPIPGDVTWDWEAGELQVKGKYNSVITSYDYASPISEAGDFCQPGINGPCKWDVRARPACSLTFGTLLGSGTVHARRAPFITSLPGVVSIAMHVWWHLSASCSSAWPLPTQHSRRRVGAKRPPARQLIRASLLNHTGNALLPTPPRPTIWPYGTVTLTQQASLLSQLPQLVPGDGTLSNLPLPMEEYGQQCAPCCAPSGSPPPAPSERWLNAWCSWR